MSAVRPGLEVGDRLIEMLHAAMNVIEECQAGSQNKVPVDQHACVVFLLGQSDDLPSNVRTFLMLPGVLVEAGQTPQNGKQLRDVTALEELYGPSMRLLNLRRVALHR